MIILKWSFEVEVEIEVKQMLVLIFSARNRRGERSKLKFGPMMCLH